MKLFFINPKNQFIETKQFDSQHFDKKVIPTPSRIGF